MALEYALTYPEQVNAMILVGPEGIPPEGGYDLEGVFFEDQLDLEGVLNDKSLSITERLMGKIGSPWAVEDVLVPPDVCNRAHDLLPNSELKMYEDVGHLIQMEATEQF